MMTDQLRNIAEYLDSRRAKANELEFISRIKADGSGIEPISEEENKELQEAMLDDKFTLQRLSISENTWIASGFHSYVVRKKEEQ